MINAPADLSDTARGARLEARISTTQKALLQRAAQLSGRTLSEFVVASAQEAASRVIEAHEIIMLTREQQAAFVQTLLNAPAPGPRLRKAAKAYKAELGL